MLPGTAEACVGISVDTVDTVDVVVVVDDVDEDVDFVVAADNAVVVVVAVAVAVVVVVVVVVVAVAAAVVSLGFVSQWPVEPYEHYRT